MITGGKSFVSSTPAFSNDARKLLVCTGNTVSVFSTTTGLLVAELEGHTARVTSIVVVPVEASAVKFMCYCWTASLDGSICYWDFAAPELVRKVQLQRQLPIHSMVIPNLQSSLAKGNEKQSKLYAFISVEDTSKALRGQIQLCDLRTSRLIGANMAETQKPECLTLSPSREYVGIPNKRKIHIWRLPLKDFKYSKIKMLKLHHTKNFSTLAFHPTERIIAGGDKTGRILVWRGFGSKKFFGRKNRDEEEHQVKGDKDDADSSPTTWHWHASEVNFLSFSSDGAYLYSGAKEGVIVVWQLDTGKKKFKPRLGSPLLYFCESMDPSLCCVSCADNQIHLLKMPSMEISKSIAGIKLPFSYPETCGSFTDGLACDHRAGVIALRTEDYCVQFFSLFDDLELFQVQVIERNYQPIDDVTIVLALLALSADGSMMGTVDVKLPEEEIGSLVSLKFWSRDSDAGGYKLSTVVYEPHSDDAISALVFHPKNGMAVSTSFGGDFKVWVHTSDAQKGSIKKSGWRCKSVGSYKKRPMTAAAFSADGSVLAIAAETVITLWDPEANALVAIMGGTSMPITKLSFVGKSGYIVTISQGSKPQLAVWNLSNLSLYWSYKLLAESISCIEDGSYFAVLVLPGLLSDSIPKEHDGLILIFDAESPVPTAAWSMKKAKGGRLAFIRANHPSLERETTGDQTLLPMLAYINVDHEYVIFDPFFNENHQNVTKARKSLASLEESDSFGYASIYGELPAFNLKKDQIPAIPYASSERPWESIFCGSSHVLPPLTNLCSAFLESLLEKRPSVVE